MTQPLIITAAIVGGELTRKDTPYLPLTPKEIAAEAVAVVRAGASVIHLHARDAKGEPRHDVQIFAEIQDEIRKQCQGAKVELPILQFSTGGSIGMDLKERMAPLALKPDMATLTTGSVNFGGELFKNDLATITAIAQKLVAEGIGIEVEIFDAGMVDNALDLERKGLLSGPLHYNFVLGVPGALGGQPENLLFLKNRLPKNATWGVAGVGRFQLPLVTLAIVLGGHVRVGLEDNIYLRKGELAKGNVPFVERVRRIAREVDRPIATVGEARVILQVGAKA